MEANFFAIIQEYVAGFLFSPDLEHVVLIKKNKPEWQKDKLNAVGGKVESGETSIQAMQREFKEEAGLDIADWKFFTNLCGVGFRVNFFYAISPDYYKTSSITEEQIQVHSCSYIRSAMEIKTVPNLKWLLPMALNIAGNKETCTIFSITEINPSYYA